MRALIHSAEQAHCSSDLLQAVEEINRRQKLKLFERIRVFYDGDLRGKTFALWGLASSRTPTTCATRPAAN